jgi:hypothetical protein
MEKTGVQNQGLFCSSRVFPHPGKEVSFADDPPSDGTVSVNAHPDAAAPEGRKLPVTEIRAVQVAGFQPGTNTAVSRITAVLFVVADRASDLPGFEIAAENGAGRNTGGAVKNDSFFQKDIQDAACKHAAHGPAFHNERCFHVDSPNNAGKTIPGSSSSVRCSALFYRGQHWFSRRTTVHLMLQGKTTGVKMLQRVLTQPGKMVE